MSILVLLPIVLQGIKVLIQIVEFIQAHPQLTEEMQSRFASVHASLMTAHADFARLDADYQGP